MTMGTTFGGREKLRYEAIKEEKVVKSRLDSNQGLSNLSISSLKSQSLQVCVTAWPALASSPGLEKGPGIHRLCMHT